MAKKLTIEAMPDHKMDVDWGDLTAIEALELLTVGIVLLEAERLYRGGLGPGFCETVAKWMGSRDCRKCVKEKLKEMQDGQSKN